MACLVQQHFTYLNLYDTAAKAHDGQGRRIQHVAARHWRTRPDATPCCPKNARTRIAPLWPIDMHRALSLRLSFRRLHGRSFNLADQVTAKIWALWRERTSYVPDGVTMRRLQAGPHPAAVLYTRP
jgi:hypothetical protein